MDTADIFRGDSHENIEMEELVLMYSKANESTINILKDACIAIPCANQLFSSVVMTEPISFPEASSPGVMSSR